MNTKHITHTMKTLFFFCLFITIQSATAQGYKYILNTEANSTANYDVLELNNQYYLLSALSDSLNFFAFNHNTRAVVSIFDENLNQIEQIPLSAIGNNFIPFRFFYENNYFYIFGSIFVNEQTYKPCFVKLDKSFKLAQNIVLYDMGDGLNYDYCSYTVLITEKKEFVFLLLQKENKFSRLFHVNNKGTVLQEAVLPYDLLFSSIVAIDSHYVIENLWYDGELLKINKDSFEKNEWVWKERANNELSDGNAIAVDNQLITTNTYYTTCKDDGISSETDANISIELVF